MTTTATNAEPWDFDRQARMAWCRVRGDRLTRAAAMREFGVNETTLDALLLRGERLSQTVLDLPAAPSRKEVENRDAESRQRTDKFMREMREARARKEARV